jgi:D-3-phosphoglycerate dehydrogenase
MKILIQSDLFMRLDILQDCLEKTLSDLGEPLEFDTIELPTPSGEVPLPRPDDSGEDDVWNKPTDGSRRVYEVTGPIDLLVGPIRDADILVVHNAAVTREVLEAGKRLKVIACGRGGPVSVDVLAATELGIPVITTPGRNAKAVAEFIIGMILTEVRNIARGWGGLKQSKWVKELYNFDLTHSGLDGAVMGMVGFGRVARSLAPLAHAFNVEMLAYDPYIDAGLMAQYHVEKVTTLEELVPPADFVVILARYTQETHQMIGEREFALMRPNAYFVNPARGGIVDYDALYSVLRDRKIRGAMLDVFATEPLSADSPLLGLDNVLMTPHIAGATRETVYLAGQMMADDIRRMLQGEQPVNCINPEVVDW